MLRLIGAIAIVTFAAVVYTPRQIHAAGPANSPDIAAALASDESRLVSQMNDERAANGVAPLSIDSELTAVARYRSDDQVSRNYFSHTTPDGTTVFDVLDNAGVSFTTAGENLAESRGYDPVQAAVDGFMQSPPHRANLLNPDFASVGVGAAMTSDGTTILTVVFTN